jgi:O-methyltransferase
MKGTAFIKNLVRGPLAKFGYEIRNLKPIEIPAATGLYRPLYSPWYSEEFARLYAIASPNTLVSVDRCYVLERLFRQTMRVPGELFECGVYKGGTAAMLAALLRDAKVAKTLYLFDTFEGMPETDVQKDWHKKGDFSDSSLETVRAFVGTSPNIVYRKGFIPDSFVGLPDLAVSFCHIDLDIYKSIMDSLAYVWPRLSVGGVIVFDDYGFPTCPGAREAVDDFFRSTSSTPLCLQTGQAIVFKGMAE